MKEGITPFVAKSRTMKVCNREKGYSIDCSSTANDDVPSITAKQMISGKNGGVRH